MQDVDCIARRGVFLPVKTGHCSNIKIDISVVAQDGYSSKYKTRVRHQLSAYPDRLVFMRFVGICRFFPLSAWKRSWKFGFIRVTYMHKYQNIHYFDKKLIIIIFFFRLNYATRSWVTSSHFGEFNTLKSIKKN